MVKSVRVQVNGQWYNLTYSATSGKYEATLTAPSKSSYNEANHYFPVTVEATDDASNSVAINDTDVTFGSALRLLVNEKNPPTISITSPTTGALITNNKPTISWTVTDDDSGVNPDTIQLTIDSTVISSSSITKQASGKTYTCSYTVTTALSDGAHTIKVDASDNDGNKATQSVVSVTVDTTPPELIITSPSEGFITNKASITVSGTTNDANKPVTVTVNGKSVTVNGDGSFSTSVDLSGEGSHVITITATDAAGKTTTITRNIKLDQTPPKVTAINITPNPVDAGKTYIVSVTVTDD